MTKMRNISVWWAQNPHPSYHSQRVGVSLPTLLQIPLLPPTQKGGNLGLSDG